MPQNVNYAVKASYIRPLLATIPGLIEKLPSARPGERPWRQLQAEVEKGTALVVVLKDKAKIAGPAPGPLPTSTPAPMATPAPAPTPRPGEMPADLRKFVDGVWHHNSSNEAWDWAGDFADNAWYQYKDGKVGGVVTRAFIAKDRQSLIGEYPNRTYSKPEINVSFGTEKAQVTMNFMFQYDGPKKRGSGTSSAELSCERFPGGWKITRFAEVVRAKMNRK